MNSPAEDKESAQILILHQQNEQIDKIPTRIESERQKILAEQRQLSEQQINKAVVWVQKNIRANLIRVNLKQQFKRIHRRKKIIKQLVETEESYIRDLGFIVSDFKMRMQSRAILTPEQGRKLFSNVDEIRQLHDIFFSTVYNHFINYHPYLIIFADVLNCILFFRIYIQYLNNFPAACDLLDEYKKSKPAFATFVSQISRLPQYRFLSLQDYMVKPIQRLPKYVLLLKQLLKNTHVSHPDYQNVKKALQQFEEVNNNNNQKLNKIRNSFKLREIESMLSLPEGIITPSTDFLFEESVQILSQQNNEIIGNCVVYLLNNTIIVSRRIGNLLNRQTQMNSSLTQPTRVSRTSGFITTSMKQKLLAIVPLKYGTSIKLNKDQCFYKNSFTAQSPEGQSCTFICTSQQQLHNLYNKIKKQSDVVVQQVIAKLKSMFQSDNINHNSTFIKAISLLDRVPEVNVLGTSERTDKMLKYTVYIVEVKIKMIRQKIFLRFSQLLELQKFINNEYGNKISIKQGLVSSSWLNNHHQKTIQERKMNIQRFIKQLLSKPEVMENGWKILLRLGLPLDFYELPEKIFENKNTESFMKKSSVLRNSTAFKKKNFKSTKNNTRFRLSVFQQQKIEELQQEEDSDNQQEVKYMIKHSFEQFQNGNPKSSLGSSHSQRSLCIQDLLKANEVNLGHYTRMQSANFNNNSLVQMDKVSLSSIDLQILVPCLSNLYSCYRTEQRHSKIDQKYIGFRSITIKCTKLQRVQNIIPLIAKQISLRYYKDFRLLIQKQYSQRILQDDELVHKLISQINRTKSNIVFRKIIYIQHQIQERELSNDKQRLSILAGQIINQIKIGKYRLNYENYLKFSVLSAIVFKQLQENREKATKQMLENCAKEAKVTIFPKYSSLSQTEQIWIKDFIKAYQIIENKLEQISKINESHIQKQKEQNMVEFHEQQNSDLFESFWTCTNVKYLALLSIVKEMEKNQIFYGCIEFPVQISDQFKKYLESQYNQDIENSQMLSRNSVQSIGINSSKISQQSLKIQRKLSDEENKNCWLGIKHNKVMFSSITKTYLLLQLQYENISKIETYSSAVLLQLKNMPINKIKLKTTSSYYIREMLVYYKNYRQVLKKICTNSDLRQSIIGMARDQISAQRPLEMDQCYL